MRIVEYRTIFGTLICETGLRIGGSGESIEIGGMDNPIIRHPVTDEPYVPGSSLKGKIRTLLEYRHGRSYKDGQEKDIKSRDNGEPCECGDCEICRIFGPHKNTRHKLGPTRAIFRDAKLTDQSRQWLQEAQISKGVFYAEVKTENMIKRHIGTAEHPRTQERVPADTEFQFEISVRIFKDDDPAKTMALLEEGLTLLQQDYLGGSGSRGYGKVRLDYKIETSYSAI
jgi:CRISPR-associated protein Csm3